MKKFFKWLKTAMVILLVLIIIAVISVFLFMQQKSFGKMPGGERLQRIEQSPYYKDGKFQTRPDIDRTAYMAPILSILREWLRPHDRTRPSRALPVARKDIKRQPVEGTVITWFGHSSYLIQTKGKNILVDPVFSKRASPVQYIGVKSFEGTSVFSAADMPDIDLLVLTHDHYDHLDYETVIALKSKVKHVLTPLGVGAHLEYWNFDPSVITEVDWWNEYQLADSVVFTATPGIHFSGRGFVQNKTFWASFVLQTGEERIFIGGDSGYGEHYKAIGKRFGPFDLAIIECGQYNKLWPDIHHMPEQSAQAAVDLNASVLMPVHWGKFPLALHAWDEPIIRLLKKTAELHQQVTTPMIGGQVILHGNYPAERWWEGID